MENEKLITKITTLIKNDDDHEIKLVAQKCGLLSGSSSIDVYALRRKLPSGQWKVLSDRPHPDWKKMSVEDYCKHGRSELLQLVGPGQILKLSSFIGKPMSCLN